LATDKSGSDVSEAGSEHNGEREGPSAITTTAVAQSVGSVNEASSMKYDPAYKILGLCQITCLCKILISLRYTKSVSINPFEFLAYQTHIQKRYTESLKECRCVPMAVHSIELGLDT